AYFDYVNSQGGVHGRKIALKTRDDKYEANLCVEATKKLIGEDKVFALVSYVGTPTTGAAMPTITEAKVPLVGPFTGAELLRTPVNRYVFNVRASYYDETEKIVEQLVSTGNKKIAVFYQDDAYGQAGLKGVDIAVAKRDLKIAALGKVERNTIKVQEAVKKLTREKLGTALENMNNVDLGDFVVGFSPTNHSGSKYVDLTMIGRGGKFIK